MNTHYEQCMRFRSGPVKGSLTEWCLKLFDQGKGLAILDAIRQTAEPYAKGTFQEFLDSNGGKSILTYLYELVRGSQDPEAHRGQFTTQLLLAWQMVQFEAAGKRVYVPSRGLQRRLLATELRGLRCEDLRLPYPCIYVEIDPTLGFRVWNESTGWHQMYGLYLTEDAGGIRVFTCGLGEGIDDALSHFYLDLQPGELLNDMLAKLFERVERGESLWAAQQGFGKAHMDDLLDSWRRPFWWAMSLVFYLTHSNPELEHVEANEELRALYRRREKAFGKKRERLSARIREQTSQKRILVARSMVVDKRLPSSASEARALLIRSLVAGHWQRYAVGPGRQERIWKFREPFWRGLGDEGSTVHEVR